MNDKLVPQNNTALFQENWEPFENWISEITHRSSLRSGVSVSSEKRPNNKHLIQKVQKTLDENKASIRKTHDLSKKY